VEINRRTGSERRASGKKAEKTTKQKSRGDQEITDHEKDMQRGKQEKSEFSKQV